MESSRLAAVVVLGCLKGLGWIESSTPFWFRRLAHQSLALFLRLLRLRLKVVRQNLEIAYPGPENARVRQALERASSLHLARLIFEVPMLLGEMPRIAKEKVDFRGFENWKRAHEQGRGVVFLSSHVGNWEIMAAAGAAQGMELLIVTKHLKPEWLHRAIEAGRRRAGVEAAYEPRTLKEVLRWLQQGKTIGIVADQYAGPPVGIRVPVFGVPTGTHSAPAMIAKRTGAAVLPVVNYRTPEGGWVVEVRPALVPEPEGPEDLAQQTAAFSRELEKDIRKFPEQWLWIHKRFKGDLSPLREGEWATRVRGS